MSTFSFMSDRRPVLLVSGYVTARFCIIRFRSARPAQPDARLAFHSVIPGAVRPSAEVFHYSIGTNTSAVRKRVKSAGRTNN